MSTISTDSNPNMNMFRDGFIDQRQLLHQRSNASTTSTAGTAPWAPAPPSNSAGSWPHDLRLPAGPPSISPFVSARGPAAGV